MIHQRRLVVVALTLAVVVAAACAKKPEPAPVQPATPTVVTPPGPNQDSIRIDRMRRDSIDRAQSAARERQRFVDDSIANARRLADAAAAAAAEARATIARGINYDYDKADLRDDAKALLDAKIPILTANTGVTIRLAGHTDNRGSGEYNLSLGQRRAAAARDYLTARGVAANRIELVSYGEERPLCQSDDESCWGQNRRAEFEITAGANTIRRP